MNLGRGMAQGWGGASGRVLTGGPTELALTDEMKMQMRNSFASIGAVINHDAETTGEGEFASDGAGGEQKVAEQGLLVGGGLAEAGDDDLGDDEQVDGRGGGDVVDDDAVLVLVFNAGGDFAGDDAFKERRHGGDGADRAVTECRMTNGE